MIVDEIYGALNYEADPETVLSRTDSALVVNSFSKYFCMTGWRLGWLVMPESLVNAVDRLAQNLFLCPPRVSQHAALAAFQPDTLELLERQRHEFGKRRDFLLPALRELGFNIPVTPTGAFYIYADCSALTGDSYRFCWDLLERAGVAITPGVDFGENQAQRHVRFAYTAGLDRLQSGIDKIRRFLADGA